MANDYTITNATKGQLVKFFMACVLGGQIFACTPIINTRGYHFNESTLPTIERGETTRDGLITQLGSPTNSSTLGINAIYYIYSRTITESYRRPVELDRKILAVYFDTENVASDYAVYALEDGIIVPIVQRVTQTQGQELSVIGQIFGNLGRLEGASER